MNALEVLFTPADFAALKTQDLGNTTCVVFDVFRATSSIVTALANGAVAVIPVEDIPEALSIHRRNPEVLLAGEREGLRIRAEQSGGVDFHLGNSPREFTPERIAGKTIVTTTTNGTRALRACAHAKAVLIGSFLNLCATAEAIQRMDPERLLVICSGTFEQTALEDALAAGALCDLLWANVSKDAIADSALIARQLFQRARGKLLEAASEARNGRRLLANPDLRQDVAFCIREDVFPFSAALQKNGQVTRI